jgi:hypothetical protein
MTTKIPLSVQSGDVKGGMRESALREVGLLSQDFAHRMSALLRRKFNVEVAFLQQPLTDELEQKVTILANGKPIKEVVIDHDNPKEQGHTNFLNEVFAAVKEFAAK